MSKITFRADDELVDRVEGLDASKSEVMREALRAYLDDRTADSDPGQAAGSLDELVAERVDAMLAERLDALGGGPQDVNLTVSLEGVEAAGRVEDRPSATVADDDARERPADERTCTQCGASVAADHVYCPNCGEKAARRAFCECGDELRSDWAFCPSCGRRTTAADVLDGP